MANHDMASNNDGTYQPNIDMHTDDEILAEQAKTIPVPSQQQRDQMAQASDQSDLSQQELESGNGVLGGSEAAQSEGHIATPAGLRQDEAAEHGFSSDEEILRADMVQGGD